MAGLRATALGVILVAGLGLRLWHLGFGLPEWYHPDEPWKARIVSRMAHGQLEPDYFYHPSFMLYASVATLRLFHLFGAPINEITAAQAGRTTVAVLGTLTILLTFLLGRRLGGAGLGLVAALLLAVAPLHVVCSHYLKEDVPLAFWGTATLLGALGILDHGRRRNYIATGILAGIAAGTKYTGLLFLALAWLAHRARPTAPRPDCGSPHLSLLAAAAGFLAVTPYALLSFSSFVLGAAHEGGNAVVGFAGIRVWPLRELWTFHLRESIAPGFGILPTALALAGLATALRSRDAAWRIVVVATSGLYLVLETSPYKPPPNFDRYVIPLLPLLAVLAAHAASEIPLRDRRGALALLLAAATVALPLARSLQIVGAMGHDTRESARAWLLAHRKPQERILLEGALNSGGTVLPAYVPRLDGPGITYCYSAAQYPEPLTRFDYVVLSSFMYDRYLEFPHADPARTALYRSLLARTPAAELTSPHASYGFHNPTIRILRAH